jgi:hypothetical protein
LDTSSFRKILVVHLPMDTPELADERESSVVVRHHSHSDGQIKKTRKNMLS